MYQIAIDYRCILIQNWHFSRLEHFLKKKKKQLQFGNEEILYFFFYFSICSKYRKLVEVVIIIVIYAWTLTLHENKINQTSLLQCSVSNFENLSIRLTVFQKIISHTRHFNTEKLFPADVLTVVRIMMLFLLVLRYSIRY